jgi:hypothetical protein
MSVKLYEFKYFVYEAVCVYILEWVISYMSLDSWMHTKQYEFLYVNECETVWV